MQLRILAESKTWIAVDKPPGIPVHPLSDGHKVKHHALGVLKAQVGRYLYPVHRLDSATTGVLLFAYTSETAAALQDQFKKAQVRKRYLAFCRGWAREDDFIVDQKIDEKPSKTAFSVLYRVTLPIPSNGFDASRYQLVEAFPETGRMHQIRKHLSKSNFPIVGDTMYGDRLHNRAFRERMNQRYLFLKALDLHFTDPDTNLPVRLRSRYGKIWHQLFDQIGICGF